MNIQYVNAAGEPIEIGSGDSHKPEKRKTRPKSEDLQHKGFSVVGFSPEHIAAAQELHEQRQKAGHEGYESDFELSAWLNSAKPHKARSKPYEVPSAAEECAELMRKAGWIRVQVLELIK